MAPCILTGWPCNQTPSGPRSDSSGHDKMLDDTTCVGGWVYTERQQYGWEAGEDRRSIITIIISSIYISQNCCYYKIQWNLWRGDTSKSVPTWQVSPRHRYISMLKYIWVHRKCNLDIPILTFLSVPSSQVLLYSETCDERTPAGMSKLHFIWTKLYFDWFNLIYNFWFHSLL